MDIDELQEALLSHCEKYITSNLKKAVTFGYILPGHGKKGKQVTLTRSEDIEDMYKAYFGKKVITLWIKNEQRK